MMKIRILLTVLVLGAAAFLWQQDHVGAVLPPTSALLWADGPPPSVAYRPASVVALGDSITYGYGAAGGDAWPAAARLLRPGISISNRGIDGNTVNLGGCRRCDLPLVQRFRRDVLAIPGAHTLVVLEGVNDILQGGNAAEIERGLATITREAHADRLRVVGCTLLPFGRYRYWTPGGEAIREAVNTWLRTESGDDAVIDTASAMGAPGQPHRLNPAYDSGDHLHPNAAGDTELARAALPVVLRQLR